MSDAPVVSLEAKSPFELRVHLGDAVPEQSVREALASGDMGFLHSYTTGSTVDGPGVRVVAWTTGCMWRCQYCHNPDTWTLSNGMPVSVAKAAEELGKYRHGLKIMSGGFTLSGGEPLMQHRFAAKLLAAAKKMGIHTTIETNGFYGDRLSDAELDTIDLVMLGIKTWDPARHLALTGKEIGPTLEFARRLAARRRPMWIRFVLVPGLTDDWTIWRRRRSSRPGSATSSAWKCCRSIRWAGTSGNGSASTTRSRTWNLRRPRRPSGRARSFGKPGSRRTRPRRRFCHRSTPEARVLDIVRSLLEQSPMLALFAAIGIGYAIGRISIAGFSLDIGAVLFAGLALGAIAPKAAPPALVSSIGLVMFLYGIGIQYGRQFFAGLRGSGLKWNALGAAGVLCALAVALVLGRAFGVSPAHALGMFAGALTSTPTLQAAIDAAGDRSPAVGYSVAYPIGIIGPILCIFVFSRLVRARLAPAPAPPAAVEVVLAGQEAGHDARRSDRRPAARRARGGGSAGTDEQAARSADSARRRGRPAAVR